MAEVCNHKRKAHQHCRDFAPKPEPLTRDDYGDIIVGCANCLKASTFGKNSDEGKQ